VFLRRWAKRLDKRTTQTTGAEAMIGEPARVVKDCDPTGTVHVRGELWEARCDAGAAAGETVTITALDGLTLVVAREQSSTQGKEPRILRAG
jgi:membrane-bound serine protease (ClpP class)